MSCQTKISIFVVVCFVVRSKLDMDLMPGFRVTWWYTGDNVQPDAKFIKDSKTRFCEA